MLYMMVLRGKLWRRALRAGVGSGNKNQTVYAAAEMRHVLEPLQTVLKKEL